MFLVISQSKLKPNTWGKFREINTEKLTMAMKDVKGLISRHIARGTENSSEVVTLSFWDSKESWLEWFGSELREEAIRPADDLLTGDLWLRYYDVEFSSP